jgi:hypothetical protein
MKIFGGGLKRFQSKMMKMMRKMKLMMCSYLQRSKVNSKTNKKQKAKMMNKNGEIKVRAMKMNKTYKRKE